MNRFTKLITAVLFILGIAMLMNGVIAPTASADDIGLGLAKAVDVAAGNQAVALGVPMNIAVVDGGGRLVSFSRMDGAWKGSIDIAQAKAFTAMAFCNDNASPVCANTAQLQSLVQPGGPLYGLQATNRKDGIVAFPGGVTLCKNGAPIGGLGVCGGSVDQDQNVAAFAAAANALTCPGQ